MKKILNISSIIFLTILSLVLVCSCNNYNSSCSVSNNPDFEVKLSRFFYKNSYNDKFMTVIENGEGYGQVSVSGPQISPYRDGSLYVEVSLDILDKKSRTKIDSRDIRINVRDHKNSSESSGVEQIVFYGLKPGEYIVSINKAICEY